MTSKVFHIAIPPLILERISDVANTPNQLPGELDRRVDRLLSST